MIYKLSPRWRMAAAALSLVLIDWVGSAAPVCAEVYDLRETGDVLQIAMPDRYRKRAL